MVLGVGNEPGDRCSSRGRDCISHGANTLEKGRNPTILAPAMGKWLGRLGSLTLVWQPV